MSKFNFNQDDLGHFLSTCLKNISSQSTNPSPTSPVKDKQLHDSYLQYLNSEWFYSVSDLQMAASDAVIWGNLKLPARLKLEIRKRLPSELMQTFAEEEEDIPVVKKPTEDTPRRNKKQAEAKREQRERREGLYERDRERERQREQEDHREQELHYQLQQQQQQQQQHQQHQHQQQHQRIEQQRKFQEEEEPLEDNDAYTPKDEVWIKCYSEPDQDYYYYNSLTYDSQWDCPDHNRSYDTYPNNPYWDMTGDVASTGTAALLQAPVGGYDEDGNWQYYTDEQMLQQAENMGEQPYDPDRDRDDSASISTRFAGSPYRKNVKSLHPFRKPRALNGGSIFQHGRNSPGVESHSEENEGDRPRGVLTSPRKANCKPNLTIQVERASSFSMSGDADDNSTVSSGGGGDATKRRREGAVAAAARRWDTHTLCV